MIDVEHGMLIEAYVSLNSRTSLTTKLGVEYIHNGGALYNALEWIEAKHRHETFSLRNTVEQAFRSLRRRIKRFNHLRGKHNLLVLVTMRQ